ncbi:MAG: cell division topological specificity factor MinE [Chloroflexi bacterium]|nr:cell division topological specificity factor MinE [Chloroflexota bacterium]
MTSFIGRILKKPPSSALQAKERLHLVLVHDRTDLSSEDLKKLKDRLIQAISDFVEIDADETEIQIQVEGREQTLIANIPLRSPRRRRK